MSNYLNIPYQDLYGVATSFKRQYAEGIPFPHISFPNFFNPDFLEEVLAEFPDLSLLDTYKFKNPNVGCKMNCHEIAMAISVAITGKKKIVR